MAPWVTWWRIGRQTNCASAASGSVSGPRWCGRRQRRSRSVVRIHALRRSETVEVTHQAARRLIHDLEYAGARLAAPWHKDGLMAFAPADDVL